MSNTEKFLDSFKKELIAKIADDQEQMDCYRRIRAAYMVSNVLAMMGCRTNDMAERVAKKTGIRLASAIDMIGATPRKPTSLYTLAKISKTLGCRLGLSLNAQKSEDAVELVHLENRNHIISIFPQGRVARDSRLGLEIGMLNTAKELTSAVDELVAKHLSNKPSTRSKGKKSSTSESTANNWRQRSVTALDLVKLAEDSNISFRIVVKSPTESIKKIDRDVMRRIHNLNRIALTKFTEPPSQKGIDARIFSSTRTLVTALPLGTEISIERIERKDKKGDRRPSSKTPNNKAASQTIKPKP